MKRYICQNLVLLLIIAFFTSCEEDPQIPAMPSYRIFKSVQTKNSIPEEVLQRGSIQNSFLFCIGDQAYFRGNANYINGEYPYGSVLYKYDSTTDKWGVAWYVTQQQLNKLEQSGQYLLAEQQRTITECLDRTEPAFACAHNGKGYILTDNYSNTKGMLEYNPSINSFTFFTGDYSNESFAKIFSTSKGIFAWSKQREATLQFSPSGNEWILLGENHYTLRNLQNQNAVLMSNDKLYIYNSSSSIGIFTSPFNTYQEKNIIFPTNYGWDNGDINPINVEVDYYGYNSNFILDNKLYLKNRSSSGENFYYEIDLTSYKLSLAFLSNVNNKNDYYYYGMYPIFIIGNKVYCYSESNQRLIEITV